MAWASLADIGVDGKDRRQTCRALTDRTCAPPPPPAAYLLAILKRMWLNVAFCRHPTHWVDTALTLPHQHAGDFLFALPTKQHLHYYLRLGHSAISLLTADSWDTNTALPRYYHAFRLLRRLRHSLHNLHVGVWVVVHYSVRQTAVYGADRQTAGGRQQNYGTRHS